MVKLIFLNCLIVYIYKVKKVNIKNVLLIAIVYTPGILTKYIYI